MPDSPYECRSGYRSPDAWLPASEAGCRVPDYRICPDLLDQFCRTWIAVSGMCRQFKLAVRRNLTGPACLIQYPQAAFIVHDKMAAAKCRCTLHFFYRTYDLFLSAQAVSHPLSLRCMHRCTRIRRRARTDRQYKLYLILCCQIYHLCDLFICQCVNSFCLCHTMYVKVIFIQFFQKCPHRLWSLDPRHLKPVLCSVRKAFF